MKAGSSQEGVDKDILPLHCRIPATRHDSGDRFANSLIVMGLVESHPGSFIMLL